jgi:indolepyruvate ferredoxin oxidoreductase
MGPQAPDRPVELQQGLLLREGLLPVLRDGAWREAQEGGAEARGRGRRAAALPEPQLPGIDKTFNIIVTGVGGTGVVTIGAILGMAAHLEGKGLGMIDMAGLAQKGGAVYSHVRLANTQDDIHAIRVTAGMADLVLGCDLVVTGTKKLLAAVKEGRTALVVNTAEVMPGDFTRNADFSLPAERIKRAVVQAAGSERVAFIEATAIAVALMGNAIAANMFMLGYAYQLGRVPLTAASIEKAIQLNGEAVKMNLEAFRWGRRAVAEPEVIAGLMNQIKAPTESRQISETLDEVIERRVAFLAEYQNAAYGERYRALVERVRAAESKAVPGQTALTEAVAKSLHRLMGYKDEYEVARLYTNGHFAKQIASTFEGENLRYEFHLAPPILARRDPQTGVPRKMTFGPWMLKAFGVLARFKGLRGTALDVFGYTEERRTERQLIRDFEALLEEIVATSTRRTTPRRWVWPRCSRRSAATATSRSATSRPPRPKRPTSWPASGRRTRRCRWRRSSHEVPLPWRERDSARSAQGEGEVVPPSSTAGPLHHC